MLQKKTGKKNEKPLLHPKNKHRERYDLKGLSETLPELYPYVFTNQYGSETIDFFDPKAVKMLNKALLKQYYSIDYWEIPENYLCPPVPGRADYIHYMSDLLNEHQTGEKNDTIKCLEIGTGANCIYPIIGSVVYNWEFVGSEIDPIAIDSALSIIQHNQVLNGKISIRKQEHSNQIYTGIIQEGEYFDLSICNPPFHASAEDAHEGTNRKIKNLTGNYYAKPILNFGGQSNELWCEGGEKKFILRMIEESIQFANSVGWFSTLVSKREHIQILEKELKRAKAKQIKIITMNQGNKSSRILAWSFFTPKTKPLKKSN